MDPGRFGDTARPAGGPGRGGEGPRAAGARAVGVEPPWVWAERRTPGQLALEIAALPAVIAGERGMLWAGLCRELRARFGTTALGWAWPLLRPLALVGAYAVLFTRILGVRLPAGAALPGETGALGIYLVVGVLVWASIAEGLTRATTAVTDHGGLVKRLRFPPEILPLQALVVEHVYLLFGLTAFLACTGLLGALGWPGGWPWPGSALWFLPLVLLVQMLLVFGLALALSALQVVLRDTQHVLGVCLTLAMFATPVFWVPSVEVLPGIAPWLGWIEANPFHHLLLAWRAVLMGGRPSELFFEHSLPASLGYVLCCGTAALILGQGLFRTLRPEFADEV